MIAAYESSDSLQSFHEFHGSYYEYGDLNQKSQTLQDFEKILNLLDRSVARPEKKLYEVGFGNGLFLALAKSRGWQVQGIDSSARNATLAKEKFDLDLGAGRFQNVNGVDSSYDAVAMLDFIEHQDNPVYFVRKAFQMLKKGGSLVLACPNEASFMRMLGSWVYYLSGKKVTYGLNMIFCWEHLACYNVKTLNALLLRGSFEPVFSFHTSTDLERYHFKPLEKALARMVLGTGKLIGKQNRVVVIGRKKTDVGETQDSSRYPHL